MQGFLEALRIQRWDDHRYYHHSRINQSLHLLSAVSFLSAYALIFKNPAASALIGWLVSMVSRQAGHFFFEPKGYDEVNQATQEHKEDIKVGYNLRRKIVLLLIWALSPALLWMSPTLFGIFPPHADRATFVQHIGQIWLCVGFGGLLFRTVQLFFIRDVRTGLVWMTKILTDPFPRLHALLPSAALPSARSADRSDGRCTRARNISNSTRRLIAWLVSVSFRHHQPSCCICRAAETNRSATAANAASV